MTDSMGPEKLVRHMQNPSYTYDEYLVCIGLGPSISSVICENPSYSGPSYPSSPVYMNTHTCVQKLNFDIVPEAEKTTLPPPTPVKHIVETQLF